MFSDDHSIFIQDFISDLEKENIDKLKNSFYKEPFQLHLGVFDFKQNFVGWSFGYQENSATYYMCNSAVLPDHRRKGLYTALLSKNIEILKNKGFQLIYSRHNSTNNSVIIPKLKAGFLISKMEVSDIFGVLVHLHYFTNDTRKKIMDYRSGQLKPDAELKRLFKMD